MLERLSPSPPEIVETARCFMPFFATNDVLVKTTADCRRSCPSHHLYEFRLAERSIIRVLRNAFEKSLDDLNEAVGSRR